MNCPNCGAPVETGEVFCKNCGAQLTNTAVAAPKQPEAPAPIRIPSQYKPLGAWGYVGYSLLFSIPIVGFICLLVFSFNDSNLNRRSYARSYWCALLLARFRRSRICIPDRKQNKKTEKHRRVSPFLLE